jgi:nucleoside-diphosphate-sugar epimerase
MILVTGASGFVGAHLTKKLSEEGGQVRALYNRNPPNAAMQSWVGVEWMQADLLDIFAAGEAMQGIDEVYHCAAIVSFNPRRLEEILHTNAEVAANVVNAALDSGVRKMVHISSVAALGRGGTQKEITEEAQWEESRLNSGYGLSKYSAEMEVWRGIGEGLEGAILNPGIILGEPLTDAGWADGSPKLMQFAYDEFPFYTQGITAFVDVQDVVRAAISLMTSGISGERFILSEGNYPFREVFSIMAEALGKKPPHIAARSFMTQLVWRASALKSAITGRPATITKETARNAQAKTFYRADKILKALPAFRYTPLRETIFRMAGAFDNHLA